MGKIIDFYKVVNVDQAELYIPSEHSIKARTEVGQRMRDMERKLPMAVVEDLLNYTWEVSYKITEEYEKSDCLSDAVLYLIDLFSVIQGERLLFERENNIAYGDYVGDKKKGSKSIAKLHSLLYLVPTKDPDILEGYAKEWVLALDKVMKMMIGMGIIDDLNLTRTVMVDLVYLMTTAFFLLED